MTAIERIPERGDSEELPNPWDDGSDWRRRNYLEHLAADLEYDLCLGADDLGDVGSTDYGRRSDSRD